MNYQKHYNQLIARGQNRILEDYTEQHHILPKCLGGPNTQDNLVRLTPEEHYVAHQLLVKLYPEHKGLIWAAIQMTGHGNGKRTNNKLYGWLKRKHISECRKRNGIHNGSFGRYWYHNPETLENGKFDPDVEEIPKGWLKGRKIKHDKVCQNCGKNTGNKQRKYCDACRKFNLDKNLKSRVKYSDKELLNALKNEKSIPAALKSLGMHPAGGNYKRAKRLLLP